MEVNIIIDMGFLAVISRTQGMRKETIIVVLSTICILCSIIAGCNGNTTDGANLFKRERCIYCHRVKGQGGTIGPDLTDVAKRRSDKWLRDQIRDPKLHYPNPGMPGHEYLSRKEINSLIKYLQS
jgi:cbb3-type cytochrome oxidase cytochrome c subunit